MTKTFEDWYLTIPIEDRRILGEKPLSLGYIREAWYNRNAEVAALKEEIVETAHLVAKHYMEVLALRSRLERAEELLPKHSGAGLRFGKNAWLSFYKLCGWDGEDNEARQRWYKESIIARQVIQWVNEVKQFLSTPKPGESEAKT